MRNYPLYSRKGECGELNLDARDTAVVVNVLDNGRCLGYKDGKLIRPLTCIIPSSSNF